MQGDINYFDSDEEVLQQQKQSIEILHTSKELQLDKPWQETQEKYLQYLQQFIRKCQNYEQNQQQFHFKNPVIYMMNFYAQNLAGLFDFFKTNNQTFDKTGIIFIYIENEIKKTITKIQKLYPTLIVFGLKPNQEDYRQGQGEFMISNSLGIFKQLLQQVRKLMSFVEHILYQLHSIINKKQPLFKAIFKAIQFYSPLDSIGRAMTCIYILDSILVSNQKIDQFWNLFKKMLKIVKTQPEKFGTNIQKLRKLEKLVVRLDKTLLSGSLIKAILAQNIDSALEKSNTIKERVGLIKNNNQLKDYFKMYLYHQYKVINTTLGNTSISNQRQRIFWILNVYAIFRSLYPTEEQKDFYKKMWTLQKKCPIIQGYSHIIIYVYKFLEQIVPLFPNKSISLDPKDPLAFLSMYLEKLDEIFEENIKSKYKNYCIWVSKMEVMNIKIINQDEIRGKTNLLINQKINNRVEIIIQAYKIVIQIYNGNKYQKDND